MFSVMEGSGILDDGGKKEREKETKLGWEALRMQVEAALINGGRGFGLDMRAQGAAEGSKGGQGGAMDPLGSQAG